MSEKKETGGIEELAEIHAGTHVGRLLLTLRWLGHLKNDAFWLMTTLCVTFLLYWGGIYLILDSMHTQGNIISSSQTQSVSVKKIPVEEKAAPKINNIQAPKTDFVSCQTSFIAINETIADAPICAKPNFAIFNEKHPPKSDIYAMFESKLSVGGVTDHECACLAKISEWPITSDIANKLLMTMQNANHKEIPIEKWVCSQPCDDIASIRRFKGSWLKKCTRSFQMSNKWEYS
ncbi:MAG: hypothetical protein HQL69_02605 [Magnetococcales bacterium]|nr:hypothetical protein [Magnetococcales bacterium]